MRKKKYVQSGWHLFSCISAFCLLFDVLVAWPTKWIPVYKIYPITDCIHDSLHFTLIYTVYNPWLATNNYFNSTLFPSFFSVLLLAMRRSFFSCPQILFFLAKYKKFVFVVVLCSFLYVWFCIYVDANVNVANQKVLPNIFTHTCTQSKAKWEKEKSGRSLTGQIPFMQFSVLVCCEMRFPHFLFIAAAYTHL